MPEEGQITVLLRAAAAGDRDAEERFAELIYDELEKMATARLYRHYGNRAELLTLEPTALVNESLIRTLRQDVVFENRRHYFSFVSKVMLRVMLDYQRRRGAAKRGGDQVRVTLSGLHDQGVDAVEVGVLESQLDELERLDERKAQVVRLKALWGLETGEIAELLGVSERTVERDWSFARTWLSARVLRPSSSGPDCV